MLVKWVKVLYYTTSLPFLNPTIFTTVSNIFILGASPLKGTNVPHQVPRHSLTIFLCARVCEASKWYSLKGKNVLRGNNNDLEVAHPQSGSSSTWFLIELEFGNVGFWGEGKTRVTSEKPLRAKERTNNKLNPHNGIDTGIWTWATLVGGKRSHHCPIPCSPKEKGRKFWTAAQPIPTNTPKEMPSPVKACPLKKRTTRLNFHWIL